MGKTLDYLTTFQLMNDREKSAFRKVGNGIKDHAKAAKELSDMVPNWVKVGGLTALLTAGGILGYQAITAPKPERICVDYRVEHAPARSPTRHYRCVSASRFKEMRSDPYTTILD